MFYKTIAEIDELTQVKPGVFRPTLKFVDKNGNEKKHVSKMTIAPNPLNMKNKYMILVNKINGKVIELYAMSQSWCVVFPLLVAIISLIFLDEQTLNSPLTLAVAAVLFPLWLFFWFKIPKITTIKEESDDIIINDARIIGYNNHYNGTSGGKPRMSYKRVYQYNYNGVDYETEGENTFNLKDKLGTIPIIISGKHQVILLREREIERSFNGKRIT